MLKNCNSTEWRERANEVRVTFSYQYKIIYKHLQESNHEIAKGRMKETFWQRCESWELSKQVGKSFITSDWSNSRDRLAKDVLLDTM